MEETPCEWFKKELEKIAIVKSEFDNTVSFEILKVDKLTNIMHELLKREAINKPPKRALEVPIGTQVVEYRDRIILREHYHFDYNGCRVAIILDKNIKTGKKLAAVVMVQSLSEFK